MSNERMKAPTRDEILSMNYADLMDALDYCEDSEITIQNTLDYGDLDEKKRQSTIGALSFYQLAIKNIKKRLSALREESNNLSKIPVDDQ